MPVAVLPWWRRGEALASPAGSRQPVRDLLGRLRLRRQCLHLLRHHGKTATGITGARRLDGGVGASRLVCSAIAVISLTTSPMRRPRSTIRDARIGQFGLLHRLGGDAADSCT